MRANPSATVTLIGSSAGKGPALGKEYAESVKNYLVVVFAIAPTRITTEGRDQPILPSEQPGGDKFLVELRAGDRRVDIVSESLILEAPVQIRSSMQDPQESRIMFMTETGTKEPLKTWSLEVTDDKGNIQNYGPYTNGQESISGNIILGDRNDGRYKVVMTGETKDGVQIRKETTLFLMRNEKPKQESLRFSILFDFNKSIAVDTYEKFLEETVAPLVPNYATVIIHGHTDIIGSDDYNMKLSQDRANDAKTLLENATNKAGKKGIDFVVTGYGSDTKEAPFENKFPEERFYNRTVIIDIVPNK
jgi:outer membrane protein OmpA-like peptidoglycan-associated protein